LLIVYTVTKLINTADNGIPRLLMEFIAAARL
jgi:hypothetical protein